VRGGGELISGRSERCMKRTVNESTGKKFFFEEPYCSSPSGESRQTRPGRRIQGVEGLPGEERPARLFQREQVSLSLRGRDPHRRAGGDRRRGGKEPFIPLGDF